MIKLIFGHKSQICIWIESRNWNGILFRLMLENPLKCNDNNVQLMYEWITWPNRLAVASMHRRCEILQQINGLHIIAENNVIFGIGILFPIRGMRHSMVVKIDNDAKGSKWSAEAQSSLRFNLHTATRAFYSELIKCNKRNRICTIRLRSTSIFRQLVVRRTPNATARNWRGKKLIYFPLESVCCVCAQGSPFEHWVIQFTRPQRQQPKKKENTRKYKHGLGIETMFSFFRRNPISILLRPSRFVALSLSLARITRRFPISGSLAHFPLQSQQQNLYGSASRKRWNKRRSTHNRRKRERERHWIELGRLKLLHIMSLKSNFIEFSHFYHFCREILNVFEGTHSLCAVLNSYLGLGYIQTIRLRKKQLQFLTNWKCVVLSSSARVHHISISPCEWSMISRSSHFSPVFVLPSRFVFFPNIFFVCSEQLFSSHFGEFDKQWEDEQWKKSKGLSWYLINLTIRGLPRQIVFQRHRATGWTDKTDKTEDFLWFAQNGV